MHDTSTHLLLWRAEQSERSQDAARRALVSHVAQLRRLDHRATQAASRARLVRLALG